MIQALARYRDLVDDFDCFAEAIARPLPLCIWTNPLKTDATTLRMVLEQGVLNQKGVELEPVSWAQSRKEAFRARDWQQPGRTLPFVSGWYLVQEEIAMTAVIALDPQPGEIILDLCAAPGNKTVQIASRLSGQPGADTGLVVANEWKAGRLSSLWSAIARMGLLNVLTLNADGRTLELPIQFDRVLVDVPCSSEGTLRKKRHRLKLDANLATQLEAQAQKAIAQLVPVQKALLDRALYLVKPGGVVVYSTCTFSPEENEAVLHEVLGDRGTIEPFEIKGLRSSPGLTTWQGQRFRPDLTHAHRYFPHHNDTGGFFVARIRRNLTSDQFSSGSARSADSTSAPHATILNDPKPLRYMGDRFGLDLDTCKNLRLLQKGRDKLWLLSCPEQSSVSEEQLTHLIERIPFQNLGLPLLRQSRNSDQLKPTTTALQRLGQQITRNVVKLTEPEQVDAFLNGRSLSLEATETHLSPENGYVHVRAKLNGVVFELGCGRYQQGVLHSQFPKALHLPEKS